MSKQIKHTGRQSRIEIPKENLWFFSESGSSSQSTINKKKSIKNDRLSIIQDDYERYSASDSGMNNTKRDCNFVVDWQMSEAF